MRRREFITLVGGAAAWPVAARGQQLGRLPTIGFFGNTAASGGGPWTAAFVQRLRELGWIDGRTATIVYRWAEGRSESYAETAAEFVRLKVDVIVSFGGRDACDEAGDVGHPDCLHDRRGPCWPGPGRVSGAAGR